MSRSLFLIDGHSQIFRAYYAPFGNLSSPTGEPTRATHVFFQMLMNLVRDKRPDYCVMVLDADESKLRRRSIYSAYKAHRDPPPEDFPVQERRIVSTLEALGMPIVRLEGHEADDVIATIACRYAGPDLHVYLVSRDKDLDQLLGPHVTLYDPMKQEEVTPERLFERKGWRPEQAVEAQILIGDAIDNVPGVPGIGPKTASKLIQKYGSARAVIEHAHELTPRQRENVLAFAPQLETTRALVTLDVTVPIELNLEAAAVDRLNWAAVQPIFQMLGFRRLIDQLPASVRAPRATEAAESKESEPDPSGEAAGNVVSDEVAPSNDVPPRSPQAVAPDTGAYAALRARLRDPGPVRYELISTAAQLEALGAQLRSRSAFAIDVETTRLHPIDADVVGIAVSDEPGRAAYVPIQTIYEGAQPLDRVKAALSPALLDENIEKVGHNLKFDLLVLRSAGMDVHGPLFDTMIAAFVLDPSRTGYGLASVVQNEFAHAMIPITDLIGRGRDQITLQQAPLSQVTEYAGKDADYTWRLYELLRPQLVDDRASLFYDTEMPLLRVLLEMEHAGIRIDTALLHEMGRRLQSQAEALAEQIYQHVGVRFNVDSPRQLGEVLFEKLGFRVVRTTRTGRSTDAETIETLASETGHPALRLLLQYRELQKLRSTYVDALPQAVSRRTGRVHTSFSQTGAITGRLASSEPNLQNIPIRTGLGREIRRAFVPRAVDEALVVADYSQVELRILAHFSQDEALLQAFQEDQDIHAVVAAQVRGVPLSEVTREMRSRAKAVNFGIVYGQSAFGLSRTTGMSRNDAQQFINDYFRRYPRVQQFIQECIQTAKRCGYVRTILGRRRPIPNIDSRNRAVRAQAERLAVNTVMQGSAADLIKTAMIHLSRWVAAENAPLRMLLQVHDELLFEAPASEAPRLAPRVAELMANALLLRVPLRVDVAVGASWLEAK